MSCPCSLDRRHVVAALSSVLWSIRAARAARQDPSPFAFRREVLDILRESFPEKTFTPSAEDEEVIVSSDASLYLGNLRASVAGLPVDKRRVAIIPWLSNAFAALDKTDAAKNWAAKDWTAAQPLLRPKLVTRDYVAPLPTMIHRPFVADLVVAAAIDLVHSDEYVLTSMVADWHVDDAAVYDRAILNLEDMSRDIEIIPRKPSGGRGAYFTVQRGDAYDAGRILLPAFRSRILDTLGSPAFAGVPNRDFMVAWSKDFSERDEFIAQIGQDATLKPYPLTATILRFDRDGIRLAAPEELAGSR